MSVLRYPGGKSKACKVLDEMIKNNFNMNDYDTVISPFFGGGSFEFYLQKQYNLKIVANDKFTPLYNFWYVCKHENDALCNELYLNLDKINKEDFILLRKNIMNDVNTEQAKNYFIINRCSFSGSTLSGGFSGEASKKRFTKSSIDRIKKTKLIIV
jgi:DNA adenine methylase